MPRRQIALLTKPLRRLARPRLLLESLEARDVPAAFVVNSVLDNTTVDAFTTLREAVALANGTAGADTITFTGAAAGATITLSMLELLTTDTATTTIDGGVAGVTIDANNTSRIFQVDTGSSLALDRLTLTRGNASDGGGVYNSGTLAVTNSTIAGNTASNYGGGLDNIGTMTVTNSTITGNTSGLHGGGVHSDGTLTMANSTVTGNSTGSSGGGGGIFSHSSSSTFTNLLVVGNTDTSSSGDPDFEVVGFTVKSGMYGLGMFTLGQVIAVDGGGLPLLANNGGPTKTVALATGSPAIDAGTNAQIPMGVTTDQRGSGFARIIGANVDFGAVESGSGSVPNGPTVGTNMAAVTVNEGSPAANTGTFSDPQGNATVTLTASVGTVTKDNAGTWSWTFTPTDSSPAPTTVTITATDDTTPTALIGTTTFTLMVNNVAPTAGVSGPAAGLRNQPQAFTLTASDPSVPDTAAGFTYTVNWGDGSPVQTVTPTANNGAGVIVPHTFTADGPYTVAVTATDKDGTTSATTTRMITITSVVVATTGIFPDPLNPGQNMLVVSGSSGGDLIVVNGLRGKFQVLGAGAPQTFSGPVSRLVVFGGGGDDYLRISANLEVPVWVFGGDGNDSVLNEGSMPSVLVGGAGSDTIRGGNGRDVIIGGSGADSLDGRQGDDLMIAGATAFDTDETALNSILAEWTSTRTYTDRVANLRGTGMGQRANASTFLTVGGMSPTAFDDGAADVLIGAAGRDWFVANKVGGVIDLVFDLAGDELLDELV